MNKKLQNFIIAVIIAAAAYFGYNVVINPPVNVLPTTVDTLQTVKVDTIQTVKADSLK